MLVYNDFDRDPRARRAASALASAGYSVTVLAVADGEREIHERDGVRVVRIERRPPQSRLADLVRRARMPRHGGRRLPVVTQQRRPAQGRRAQLATQSPGGSPEAHTGSSLTLIGTRERGGWLDAHGGPRSTPTT